MGLLKLAVKLIALGLVGLRPRPKPSDTLCEPVTSAPRVMMLGPNNVVYLFMILLIGVKFVILSLIWLIDSSNFSFLLFKSIEIRITLFIGESLLSRHEL